jgi:hypothetical protein
MKEKKKHVLMAHTTCLASYGPLLLPLPPLLLLLLLPLPPLLLLLLLPPPPLLLLLLLPPPPLLLLLLPLPPRLLLLLYLEVLVVAGLVVATRVVMVVAPSKHKYNLIKIEFIS